jgi:hypothetical protein
VGAFSSPPPVASTGFQLDTPPSISGSRTPTPSTGLELESLPGQLQEDIDQPPPAPRLGPTPVSQVNFLMDYLCLRTLFGDTGIRAFGWVEGGYSGASPGTGVLSVQPRQNRFGNEFLLNQIGFVVEKPLQQEGVRPTNDVAP